MTSVATRDHRGCAHGDGKSDIRRTGRATRASAQAARELARRLRLPRQKANDGKTLVMVDMDEIDHKPKPAAVRSSGDDHAAVAVLAAKIEALQAR